MVPVTLPFPYPLNRYGFMQIRADPIAARMMGSQSPLPYALPMHSGGSFPCRACRLLVMRHSTRPAFAYTSKPQHTSQPSSRAISDIAGNRPRYPRFFRLSASFALSPSFSACFLFYSCILLFISCINMPSVISILSNR